MLLTTNGCENLRVSRCYFEKQKRASKQISPVQRHFSLFKRLLEGEQQCLKTSENRQNWKLFWSENTYPLAPVPVGCQTKDDGSNGSEHQNQCDTPGYFSVGFLEGLGEV